MRYLLLSVAGWSICFLEAFICTNISWMLPQKVPEMSPQCLHEKFQELYDGRFRQFFFGMLKGSFNIPSERSRREVFNNIATERSNIIDILFVPGKFPWNFPTIFETFREGLVLYEWSVQNLDRLKEDELLTNSLIFQHF